MNRLTGCNSCGEEKLELKFQRFGIVANRCRKHCPTSLKEHVYSNLDGTYTIIFDASWERQCPKEMPEWSNGDD